MSASEILQGCEAPAKAAAWILEATRELRRRGDTLVTRDDLRTVLRHVDPLGSDAELDAAWARLDTALRGS